MREVWLVMDVATLAAKVVRYIRTIDLDFRVVRVAIPSFYPAFQYDHMSPQACVEVRTSTQARTTALDLDTKYSLHTFT